MSVAITILKTTNPATICKRYTKRDGKLHKTAVAHVTQGKGRTVQVAGAQSMAQVLSEVTASHDRCIVPGEWLGAGVEPFELVTEKELARLTGDQIGDVRGGVHVVDNRRVAARLRRGITPSSWLLIDADNPAGIPPEWAAMSLAQRLEFLEPLIPGISRCERIELRSSSARVVNGSGKAGPASHAWLRVSDPDRIELLRSAVQIRMVTAGKAFASPRYSRKEPDKIIGHEQRTVIDLSVWIPGRIVFNAKPELGAGMEAYTVADPGITIVNAGGGVLDISGVTLPEGQLLAEYRKATGIERKVEFEAGGRIKTTISDLTWDTPIERRGDCKTLREWATQMKPGERLRCEAPFRDSASEAAFIKLPEDGGAPYVHDVGNTTTYTMAEGQPTVHDRPRTMGREEAIRRARDLLSPSLKDREAPAYPMHALGPLAEACQAIADGAQVQAAMAGQCLLGAASLVTMGLFNVETLSRPRPLSLYLLTLGDSGDGKSTAQDIALRPVHEWQRKAGDSYRAALADLDRAKVERRGKKGAEPLPEQPSSPYRLARDATVEGLRRDLDTGPCAQGVFTDEAAAVLSGYGMSAEHRSKTAGVFSGLWDTGHLSVSRGTDGRVERYGRRIALHWLIQPAAAAETLGDPLLSSLGFWPRFLAAWPAALEPRINRRFHPDAEPAVAAHWQRCKELLEMTLPDDADPCPVLQLTDNARTILGAAFERFEVLARRGELRPVKPFALRAIEQTCRVAGVLAAFAGQRQIDGDTARNALALVSYSLETWRALIDEGAADQGGATALRLYQWLTERPGWRERLATIVKDGPAPVRTKDKRDAALALLAELGLVKISGSEAIALEPQA